MPGVYVNFSPVLFLDIGKRSRLGVNYAGKPFQGLLQHKFPSCYKGR